MANVLIKADLPGLSLISRGKVRDIYSTSSPDYLLFVTTDRTSAYDVVLKTGIPEKGKILNKISRFWFEKLQHIIPNHFVTTDVEKMPEEFHQYKDLLEGRTMLVKKTEVIPLEAIVRGYLTGSAWIEYKASGTIHGMPFPKGLVECEKLATPVFTPSTKAEQGAHDENISPEQGSVPLWASTFIIKYRRPLYMNAADYARSRGMILADTKFEFGLISTSSGKSVILIDELLTPDSSRYWPLASYAAGRPQISFDKQYLRDWLVSIGFRRGLESGPERREGEGWSIEESVVKGTTDRYAEALELLVG